MPRVASLYLPNLATDRLRRLERLARPLRKDKDPPGEEQEGARTEDHSSPRGGGWRPGARWARAASKDASRFPSYRQMPEEGDKPLITIHRSGPRMVIAAACPAAQALGLHPAMAAAKARAMVPGLDIRDAEAPADAAWLDRLGLFAARRWTPRAAVSGSDGLLLDLDGVAHLFGGEERMCKRILRFCARLGYHARIAVAGTAGAAHALARHGSDRILLCAAGGEAEALAPLPLAALRIEEEMLVAARRLGIERIGDLLAMPRGPLSRRFRPLPGVPRSSALIDRLDQALGRVPEPFDPIVPEDPPSVTLRLLEPIATAEAIEQVVRDLMTALMHDLEKAGLAVRTLSLFCLRVDGGEQEIVIGTARATRDGDHLLRLLCPKIEQIEPGFGIEAMRLLVTRCEPLAPQPIESILSGEQPAPDLVPLIDRLAGRLGAGRLFRSSAVESDVPERSVRRVGPLVAAADWPSWPRPVRLLSPPERVENVMAELPDHPPIRFRWRGRMHIVRRGDGPERIFGEWWRHGNETDAVRDYFQVEDDQGARFWLYRRGDGVDSRTGDLGWYMHGLFG